jgi:hypothetical protein
MMSHMSSYKRVNVGNVVAINLIGWTLIGRAIALDSEEK